MIEIINYNNNIFQADKNNPSWRFKGASKPNMPAQPAPVATPREVDADVKAKDIERRRQRIAASGRGGTILTELSNSDTAKASLLGRSTS